ncbi:MAG: type II toxin-antitoxin system HicB family antitoxin [Xanthobacteraceae bacterium]
MKPLTYPARLTPDEDGRILVTFRDIPGATDGADQAEAMIEAVDFLESALAHFVHHGEEVPAPSAPRRNEILVGPSAVTAAQVALYLAMRQEGVSPAVLAKRLGLPVREVRRLIDLANYPPLETIERALAALGHRLTVALDAAE